MNENRQGRKLADWQKVLLFLCLLEGQLPPWARGEDQWKALAALTGWPKKRCSAAFQEAGRRGMAQRAQRIISFWTQSEFLETIVNPRSKG